jgi:hypothetical protein
VMQFVMQNCDTMCMKSIEACEGSILLALGEEDMAIIVLWPVRVLYLVALLRQQSRMTSSLLFLCQHNFHLRGH